MNRNGQLRSVATVVSLVAAIASSLGACAGPGAVPTITSGATIDGFPLGPAESPDPDIERVAHDTLDHKLPGHAAVVRAQDFLEPAYITRSGGFWIVVFSLADGSVHAVGVHCGPGGCAGYETYPS